MISLLMLIFVVELAVQIINTVGASTINDLLWRLVNLVPTELSRQFSEQRKMQQEYLKVRTELNKTSSQDEFAKWAKLRRQHDKLLENLEKKKSSLAATRSKFDSALSVVRLILTRGLQYFLPFWYGKVPMFWLPHGWFPYWAEWVLSFPRAPIGSVSIASWQLACTGVLSLLSDAIVAMIALAMGTGQQQREKRKMEQPVAADAGGKKKTTKASSASDEKKEL